MKKRIWELDAFRGICVLGMVLVHLVYDLVDLYHLIPWKYPAFFLFVKDWGGVTFLMISGISATLGSHSVRRGLIVLVCSLVVSGATVVMYLMGMANRGIIIWFGVLQCLGVCMLAWAVLKKLPTWAQMILGIALVAAGLYIRGSVFGTPEWMMPLGFVFPGFVSSDYFPVLPHLGFFLLGAVAGKWLYPQKKSLFPKVSGDRGLAGFLCLCGRWSLPIYMLHQPVLTGITGLIAWVVK